MSLRSNLENLDDEYWCNAHVRIKPLKTEADLIYAAYDCQLSEEQKKLVNPAWFSIGRAYLFKEDNYPCIIYSERMEPIGFINLCKWLGSGEAYSWSYFIDKKHQGKGYGKYTAQLAVSILKAADPNQSIKLATEKCNIKAQQLYIALGFVQLDELDGDDLVFGL